MKKELTNEQLRAALTAGFTQAQGVKGWNTKFVPKSADSFNHKEMDIKAIAYYLPQFHPIEENNNWWGKGFTEWTNVSKAVPQFLGHYQPHLPGELGFYDLRLADNLREQAKLARHYGIYGFCIHHYWFAGHQLLETPVNLLLENKDIDINFCLCWANENWSRRWDGLENDILIQQNHSDEDDIAFIESLLPAFQDPRYIRIDNKPVLVVYRATLLPDAKKTALRWRERVKLAGFDDLYIVAAKSFDIESPLEFDFDAAVEFPPHKIWPKEVTEDQVILNPDYSGKVYCYQDAVNRAKQLRYQDYTTFRCVMPSWDNEARKPGNGFSFTNVTSEAYEEWLSFACAESKKNRKEERFVFINAWNEWAEGAHLEPCREFGYKYLHITANTIRNFSEYLNSLALSNSVNDNFTKKSDQALVLHLYYEDVLDEILTKVKSASHVPDLLVTVPKWNFSNTYEKLKKSNLNFYILPVDNKGRDIRPFLKILKVACDYKYNACCKLHSKKSLHRVDGDIWRDSLYSSLLDFDKMKTEFTENEKYMIAATSDSVLDLSVERYHAGNIYWLKYLLEKFGYNEKIDNFNFNFVAGSMFWFKPVVFKKILEAECLEQIFEPEMGQLDGTLAHSLERVFFLLATDGDNGKMLLLDKLNSEIQHP